MIRAALGFLRRRFRPAAGGVLLPLLVASTITVACSAGGDATTPSSATVDPLPEMVESMLDQGPTASSDDYSPPSTDQVAALQAAARSAADGEPQHQTDDLITSHSAGVTIILEGSESAPSGWGLFALREPAPPVAIEVPHPRADLWTEAIGVRVFQSSDAAALLVAGAHREASGGKADVAHHPGSAFQAVHEELASPPWTVLALHGFASDKHPEISEDIVVSDGTRSAGGMETLIEILEEHGFSVCAYDGTNCLGLGGTTDLQGQSANAAGADFRHLELSDRIRKDELKRQRLIDALSEYVATLDAD